MKIIFNRSKILEAVTPLMCAVSGKTTFAAIDGILIEAEFPDICVLTTYDLKKGVRVQINAKILEEGSYIINAQKFSQTLKYMDKDEITLTVDEKLSAVITSGKSSHRMMALPGEDFPSILELKSDRGFLVSQETMLKMLTQISFAMGKNDQRAVLNGCFVKIKEDTITMVSCDSFKLAKCSRKTDLKKTGRHEEEGQNFSFIIPCDTVENLIRLLSPDKEALTQIYLSRKHIVFLIGDIILFSLLIEGDYIDYDRIIVKNHRIKIELNKEEFLSALERATLITEERIAGSVRAHVKLEAAGGIMKISATSASGSTYDEINTTHDGEEIVIAFNNSFLISTVKACEGDLIKLSLSSPLTSMNIEPLENKEGEEEIFMLLPVRMKD